MMVSGILLEVLGLASMIAGGALIATGKDRITVYKEDVSGPYEASPIDDDDMIAAGAGLVIGGGVAIVAGPPLAILGGRSVPIRRKDEATPATRASTERTSPRAPPVAQGSRAGR